MRFQLLFALLFVSISSIAQEFTRQDSLRGSITPERAWWDLTYYHLQVEVVPENKWIAGNNTIRYKVLEQHNVMQVDLQTPLTITKVTQNGTELSFKSEGNAHFVTLKEPQTVGAVNEIVVHYEGKPKEAVRAPWDGGFSWKKDADGNDFIATSNQGLGASVWWPNKDHMYDEVDSMDISVEVPEHLSDVSNGRLIGTERNRKKKTKTFHWQVKNPINNYGVNLNIGNYVSWEETYAGEKGDLDITYWALKVDEEKARKQFTEVPRMLDALEHWFGPYPFYEDGYQLVQAPYLGMEHQSSVTYGNRFENGYLGRDLSTTGWGLKFDFIIVHESGHEWFANNITHKDHADMWIHESFTNYSESLFLDYHFGKAAGQEYVRGTRTSIGNNKPMIGPYGVNYSGYPGDVYYKGGNMLNTLRTIVNNDEQWRGMLRALGDKFYHQTVTSEALENYMAEFLGLELNAFFDQYLRDRRLATLEYYFKDGKLYHRWINAISSFDMPVDVEVNGKSMRIEPRSQWNSIPVDGTTLTVEPNYYIAVLKSR
ncbi:M1 family metallopeptidase [Roseivirga pacifica]|uniref:M1 family metallopeptidase n=1 Tax=Roseivirga pacifica TaxID=1267423 RepID=UPI0020951723|nr:M1 family metallopeptidase [Roseivirga pacifica]MCO6360923.1 M1 family peptidase [Roseivirga pacifica]MCO6368812.1 M1 family peptidase [Roseivirga pacifica]MCO6372956.1 M1 family peptidase [Roseivirga pacifica]MCO6377016.1 M1 family peptidase [Roseivirga pacifica]MCO6377707.1 M1 family peptidase [Roseivirga pacifica]